LEEEKKNLVESLTVRFGTKIFRIDCSWINRKICRFLLQLV